MQVNLTGKNMVLSDPLERYATDKFSRLARYQHDLEHVDVEITLQSTREVQGHYVCQANLIAAGRLLLRGEERAGDPYVAIDTLVDSLEQRLDRQHERWESRRRLTIGGHLPPTPPEAQADASTMEAVLSEYGIDAETIGFLEDRGIHTMEQLRALVDEGRLAGRLGSGHQHEVEDLVRIVEKLRL